MATVASDAMFDDDLMAYLAPSRHQYPLCFRQRLLRRAKKRFYGGGLLLVAVTDARDAAWTGREFVVGYLSAISTRQRAAASPPGWNSVFSWNALELGLLWMEETVAWYSHADRSMSRANVLTFVDHINQATVFADLDEYWDVDFLAISPASQRQGIGSALMAEVQKIAAQDQLPIVLVASAPGRPMYQKLGFVDRGPFDFGAGHTGAAMVWYPDDTAHVDSTAPDERRGW